jgi:Ca2+:H+ antiporter
LTCVDTNDNSPSRDCRRCYFSQVPALDDRFYLEAVRPYCWFAAVLLFLSYIIGLWFTLRTHAAVIWNIEIDEKKQATESHHTSNSQPFGGTPYGRQRQPTNTGPEALRGTEIRESQLYKKMLGQTLKQVGLGPRSEDNTRHNSASDPSAGGPNGTAQTPHLVPPRSSGGESATSEVQILGFTEGQNANLREVAEMAATAATIAARDATRAPRKESLTDHGRAYPHTSHSHQPPTIRTVIVQADGEDAIAGEMAAHSGGHDAPNWSRMKSSIILMGATILYALIAEILVNTVDVVLEGMAIDEKFLGITLFALVPNTTEFLVGIRHQRLYKP